MKKYGKKIIGAILMALAIVLTQIPMPVLEATSATADFERDGDTLIHYTGTASAVSVPAGIKEIASEAFADILILTYHSFISAYNYIAHNSLSFDL